MLHHAYQIHDLKVILELGDSARHTLLQLLEQFDGSHSGKFDRSHMNTAEKQKAKRGIKELIDKKVLFKVPSTQNKFEINTQVIFAHDSREGIRLRIMSNKAYDTDRALLDIFVALQEFEYDLFNTPAEITLGKQVHTSIPYSVFKNTIDPFYSDKNCEFFQAISNSVLMDLYQIYRELERHLNKLSLTLTIDNEFELKGMLRDCFIQKALPKKPSKELIEEASLQRYVHEWFTIHYPEYTL
jgi:hypothetical protein